MPRDGNTNKSGQVKPPALTAYVMAHVRNLGEHGRQLAGTLREHAGFVTSIARTAVLPLSRFFIPGRNQQNSIPSEWQKTLDLPVTRGRQHLVLRRLQPSTPVAPNPSPFEETPVQESPSLHENSADASPPEATHDTPAPPYGAGLQRSFPINEIHRFASLSTPLQGGAKQKRPTPRAAWDIQEHIPESKEKPGNFSQPDASIKDRSVGLKPTAAFKQPGPAGAAPRLQTSSDKPPGTRSQEHSKTAPDTPAKPPSPRKAQPAISSPVIPESRPLSLPQNQKSTDIPRVEVFKAPVANTISLQPEKPGKVAGRTGLDSVIKSSDPVQTRVAPKLPDLAESLREQPILVEMKNIRKSDLPLTVSSGAAEKAFRTRQQPASPPAKPVMPGVPRDENEISPRSDAAEQPAAQVSLQPKETPSRTGISPGKLPLQPVRLQKVPVKDRALSHSIGGTNQDKPTVQRFTQETSAGSTVIPVPRSPELRTIASGIARERVVDRVQNQHLHHHGAAPLVSSGLDLHHPVIPAFNNLRLNSPPVSQSLPIYRLPSSNAENLVPVQKTPTPMKNAGVGYSPRVSTVSQRNSNRGNEPEEHGVSEIERILPRVVSPAPIYPAIEFPVSTPVQRKVTPTVSDVTTILNKQVSSEPQVPATRTPVQRSIKSPEAASSGVNAPEVGSKRSKQNTVDLRMLAREVYPLIKHMIMVERERRPV